MWSWFAAALAGQVEVHTGAAVVLVAVDGELVGVDEDARIFAARRLPSGVHQVEVRSMLGKVITSAEVELGEADVARFLYRDDTLLEAGLVPADAPPTELQVVAGEVMIWLDGTPLSSDPVDFLRKRSVRPGTHRLTAFSAVGTRLTEVTFEVEAGQIVRYQLDDSELVALGAAPVGTPVESLPGAEVVTQHQQRSATLQATLGAVTGTGSPQREHIDPEAFDKLIERVSSTNGTSDARIAKIETAVANHRFTCKQVGRLMDTVAAAQQIEVLKLARPAITNPAQCEVLLDKLTTPQDKRAGRALFDW